MMHFVNLSNMIHLVNLSNMMHLPKEQLHCGVVWCGALVIDMGVVHIPKIQLSIIPNINDVRI